MKIIVWGINYVPEITGIAVYNTMLCEFLQQRGHDVRMVTTFAYYPAWEKSAEDAGCFSRNDFIHGVAVHRCWHYVPKRVTTFTRILHEASFVASSFLRFLLLPRPDVFVVISPPLLLGAAAWVAGLLKRVPHIFHAQDLQPDAAIGLGMLKPSLFTRALYWLESLSYAKAARVSGISHGMLATFRQKGVPDGKLVYFPNGTRLPKPTQLPVRGQFRLRRNLPPAVFLAVYSGNLGVKQGLDILFDAAAVLKNERVKIIVAGDGARRHALEKAKDERGLKNLMMLPLLEERDYLEMLVDADVCLITQQAGSGNSFFPSKLLVTLGLGKPVVTVADDDSELARAVKTGAFGVNLLPGEHESLARLLESLSEDSDRLPAMGVAGRRFVEQFEISKVLGDFEQVLLEVAGARSDPQARPVVASASQ